MRASRLILIFIVSMIVKCGIPDAPPDPVNPYDPNNPDYEPASVTIVSGPSDGETTHSSDVTFSWTGNETAEDFSYRLDNNSWSNWSANTSVTYEYLDEKTYLFEIIARAGNQDQTIGDTTSLEFTVDAVEGPALMIYPRYETLSVGNTTTLEIIAEEVDSLMGVEVELLYDPTIIHIDNIMSGPFLTANGGLLISFKDINAGNQKISIVLVRASSTEPTVSGTGTVAVLELTGLSAGVTVIEINTSIFKDQDNNEIDITQRVNGIIVVE